MTWDNMAAPAYSGGQRAKDAENWTHRIGAVNVTPSTARPNTGSYGNDHDLSVNSNKGCLRWGTIGNAASGYKLIALSGFFGVDAAPSAAAGLGYFSGTDAGTPASGGKPLLETGTDRLVRIYDKNFNQVGPAVPAQIPTAGLLEVQAFFDALSWNTVYVWVFIGGIERVAFDTGRSWDDFFDAASNNALYCGEALPASNRGIHLFSDDVVAERSLSAADSPWKAQYIRPRVSEPQNPTAGDEGTAPWTAGHWDEGSAGAGASYADIDNGELASNQHDGDTSYLQTTVENDKYYVSSSDANPITVGASIRRAQQKCAQRATGAAKLPSVFLTRLGGVDAETSGRETPATTYGGSCSGDLNRPGGGAWARGDFDASSLSWGMRSDATDAGARVTWHLGPEAVFWNDLLPLASTPRSIRPVTIMGLSPGVL